MAGDGNPLQASSPTARFAPSNRRARRHGLFKMGPNQRVIKGGCGNSGHRKFSETAINSIRLALEATSLAWMEGEKERSVELSLTAFASCVESSGSIVAKDFWRGGSGTIAI